MLTTHIGKILNVARRARDPGSNPGSGENFSLKLLVSTCQMVILKTKFTFNNNNNYK